MCKSKWKSSSDSNYCMLIGLHSGFIDDAIMLQENNGSICTYLALLILWLFSVSTETYWRYQPAHKLDHEMDHWKFSPWAHSFSLVLHRVQYCGCHSSSRTFMLHWASVVTSLAVLCSLLRKHFVFPLQPPWCPCLIGSPVSPWRSGCRTASCGTACN